MCEAIVHCLPVLPFKETSHPNNCVFLKSRERKTETKSFLFLISFFIGPYWWHIRLTADERREAESTKKQYKKTEWSNGKTSVASSSSTTTKTT